MARLILDDTLKSVTGKYFQINNQIDSSSDSMNLDFATQLWKESSEIVGLGQ